MRTIHLANEEDGEPLLSVARRAGVFTPMELACVQELWEAYRQKGEASGYIFLVCREEGRVVGFLCFGPTPLTIGTFDLYWIAVDPAVRGQGIGHALMDRMEQEVARRDGRLILVETSGTPAYAEARRFYESCGYHYQAVVHDFYRPGDDLLIFGKPVAPGLQPAPAVHSHLTPHAL
jgi:GNAT superfamily N-acetyltransferase